jgi:hypothetical protein
MLFAPFLSILENALMAIIFQRENVVTNLGSLKEQIIDSRSLIRFDDLYYFTLYCQQHSHYCWHPLSVRMLFPENKLPTNLKLYVWWKNNREFSCSLLHSAIQLYNRHYFWSLKTVCKKRIPVFLNESSTSYNNNQASKGKADDAIARPQKTRSGNDRLKSINRITHWFWAMPGCNRRQCIYVEKAQSACPWARPLLRDIYHLLS